MGEDIDNAIRPPWRMYPGSEPWWGGWRQGDSEHWFLTAWLPYWQSLTKQGRAEYLVRWPPPSEDWNEYLLGHWVGKADDFPSSDPPGPCKVP